MQLLVSYHLKFLILLLLDYLITFHCLPPKIYYISFTSNNVQFQYPSEVYSETFLNIIEDSDDSPFQSVSLPFPFVFFGRAITNLFASPNGAVHTSYNQPCYPYNIFGGDTCNLQLTYTDQIAGFLTDLNPSRSVNSSISVVSSSSKVTFKYEDICYYNSTLKNSFRISIFKDSHVELNYDKLTFRKSKNYPLPMNKLWESGMKSHVGDLYTYYDRNQLIIALNDWQTIVPGIFPAMKNVKTGNRFIACPLSLGWCMTPATISVYTWTSSFNISLSALSLSCADEVQFSITLSPVNTASPSVKPSSSTPITASSSLFPSSTTSQTPSLNPSVSPIPTTSPSLSPSETSSPSLATSSSPSLLTLVPLSLVPSASPSSSPQLTFDCLAIDNVLTCHVPNAQIFNTSIYQNFLVSVLWRPLSTNSKTTTTLLPLSPLPLLIRYVTTTITPTKLTFQNCSTSGVSSTTSVPASCSNSLCSNNNNPFSCRVDLRCLSLPCANSTSPRLYQYPSCNNTCPSSSLFSSTNLTTTGGKNSFYPDLIGVCCKLKDLDCSGLCRGPGVLSKDVDGANICCPSASLVGCNGVCFDNKKYDGCGVCGGKDNYGVSCYNYTKVSISTGYKNNGLYPALNANKSSNPDLLSVVFVNITNNSDQDIYVYVKYDISSVAPDIINSMITMQLVVKNSSYSLPIKLSFLNLYMGRYKNFGIKTIDINYKRVSYTGFNYRFSATIYPPTMSYNCESITSYGACARLPACIFCYNSNGVIRTLRSDNDSNYNNNNHSSFRSLFSNIMPYVVNVNSANFPTAGYCVSGWYTDDCYNTPHPNMINAGVGLYNNIFKNIMILLFSSLWLLL